MTSPTESAHAHIFHPTVELSECLSEFALCQGKFRQTKVRNRANSAVAFCVGEIQVEVLESGLELLNEGASSDEVLNRLAVQLSSQGVLESWVRIEPTEIETEVQEVSNALVRMWTEHQPPNGVEKLWFWLYEVDPGFDPTSPTQDRWSAMPVLDVAGSAGTAGSEFSPMWGAADFVPTKVLSSIPRRVTAPDHSKAFAVMMYSFAFLHAIHLSMRVLEEVGPVLFDGRRTPITASTGFHDGDFTAIGELSGSGFKRIHLPSW